MADILRSEGGERAGSGAEDALVRIGIDSAGPADEPCVPEHHRVVFQRGKGILHVGDLELRGHGRGRLVPAREFCKPDFFPVFVEVAEVPCQGALVTHIIMHRNIVHPAFRAGGEEVVEILDRVGIGDRS